MAKADHKGQPSRIRRNVQRYGDPEAYQGEVSYRWSEDTKYLHGEWVR
jgi:hypothetical protein